VPEFDFIGIGRKGLNDAGMVHVYGYTVALPTVAERHGLWNRQGARILSCLDLLYPQILPPDPNDFNSGPSSFSYSQSDTNLNNARQFAAAVWRFDYDPVDPNNPDDDISSDQFVLAYVFDGKDGYSLLQPQTSGDVIEVLGIDNNGVVFGWTGGRLALWNPDGSLKSILPDPPSPLLGRGPFGARTAQRNELGQVVAITAAGVALYDPALAVWTPIIGRDAGDFFTIQDFNDRGQFVGTVTPPLNHGGWFGYVATPGSSSPVASMWAR
jgi:hypothetical protein